jgi:hypothetical protein
MTIIIHLHAARIFFLTTDVRKFSACLELAKVEQKLTNVRLEYLRQCN